MTVLDDIVAGVREDLAERRRQTPLADVIDRAREAQPARAFDYAGDFGVIAEVKRRSPSRGDLAHIPDPGTLAGLYAAGGARAISVLTEGRRFSGSLEDLDSVRAAVDIPVLRKDFMVEEYQFHEARAHGADLVLLIVAALEVEQLHEFHALAHELGMTALVETHNAEELAIAAELDAPLIGINTRNLKDLSVDTNRFAPLADLAPANCTLVAESGVTGREDVETYAGAGADLVLVGEALVTGGDAKSAVADFTATGRERRAANSLQS
ncbi:MAG: indole-3-glycerol phosphate synthase TrpC [Brevibacterium aurantiacum]|uniref:Indole-3-glycerol phosphate synthase n=2 Tax=Brevibacterium TaxID=1696 RepID=A0A2H1HR71_BREAU|nr:MULTISPECIES: indole-3-glycerol phosphate synthase TrpC [Brevibacterium]MDN5594792.1 indole-3-glycerol phosphate synthase TrpC [Brevibacterium sp.]MDN5608876.1 indole-3-glycerol phosphate synthase TrpC [Brevibacterium sp.]MDN5735045.1 indole-3-glycerol phosphate synthase TrpC [Brevibacterium aurantiacum]MDN5772189.1 indole-3-glycerol phosphate synthase TrpC [Brevibacterium aurantiacum]PCC47143.1 indole-3-glycerol-phosphate synthase [Brevibacterium aurantiacum]